MISKFSEPGNTMVITTEHIISHKKDILYVFHDADDGMWQFLDDSALSTEDARIVSLSEIINIDNSINELYNLPLGGTAYRSDKQAKWNFI